MTTPARKRYNRRYRIERSAALKALGICQRCGQSDARPGRTTCQACLGKVRPVRRDYMAKRYRSLVAAGRCTGCKKAPARPGLTTCQACSDRIVAYKRERRQREAA
jgi:hypothetical protein